VTLSSNLEQIISGNPYFFMIKNTGTNNVYLESLTISYSCIPTSGSSSSSLSSSTPVSSVPVSSEYTGYYASIQGLSDENLLSTLRTKLRLALTTDGTYGAERLKVNYDNAGDGGMLFASDRDPNNASNVIVLYSNASVIGAWDNGSTWNREHVFPQSLMGVSTSGSSRHKGADLHNLKPANPSQNSSRNNSYYSETFISGTTYVPPANVRGDLARILFYMITMYPELSLVDIVSGDPATYQMAQFSLMVKWHIEDPVDAFEANRNEVIYGFQDNRNPYIDHQELVCRIWRNTNVSTQGYCAA
jgi:endonuclease I